MADNAIQLMQKWYEAVGKHEPVVIEKIRLHGELKEALGDIDDSVDLFLIDGGIATKEQFNDFSPGFAHCYPGGAVLAYGEIVGHRSDIEIVDQEKI